MEYEQHEDKKITNSKSVCRLVGMVLIIMGLYSFLWSKKNDTQKLSQPNVAAAEGSTMMADGLTATQSTSTVVPSASPTTDSVILEIEKTENN